MGGKSDKINGSIALQLIALLPLFMLMAVGGLEVSRWQEARYELQRECDDAVYAAVLKHPYEEQVLSVMESRQSKLVSKYPGQISYTALDGRVSVEADMLFASPSLKQLMGEKLAWGLPMRVQSTAVLRGADVVLVFDDGRSFHPGLGPTGTPLPLDTSRFGIWPASAYFRVTKAPQLNATLNSWEWWKEWRSRFAEWATYGCYNTPLLQAKTFAIQLADAIVQTPKSRMALVFSPGSQRGQEVSILRDLLSEEDGDVGNMEQGLSNISAQWLPRRDPDFAVGDELCVLIAEPIVSGPSPYVFPEYVEEIDSGCPLPAKKVVAGTPHVFGASLESCYFSNEKVPIQRAIHWRAVDHQRGFSFATALRAVMTQFSQVHSEEQSGRPRFSKRIAVFVLGEMPRFDDEARQLLANLKDRGVLARILLADSSADSYHPEAEGSLVRVLPIHTASAQKQSLEQLVLELRQPILVR